MHAITRKVEGVQYTNLWIPTVSYCDEHNPVQPNQLSSTKTYAVNKFGDIPVCSFTYKNRITHVPIRNESAHALVSMYNFNYGLRLRKMCCGRCISHYTAKIVARIVKGSRRLDKVTAYSQYTCILHLFTKNAIMMTPQP
jgi:hypothetical protein